MSEILFLVEEADEGGYYRERGKSLDLHGS
jgi:hypothetical protein